MTVNNLKSKDSPEEDFLFLLRLESNMLQEENDAEELVPEKNILIPNINIINVYL